MCRYIETCQFCTRHKKGVNVFRGLNVCFQVTVVLLTAQIHQGTRLSSLKVLVTRIFRPASNLLLRFLRIWNNMQRFRCVTLSYVCFFLRTINYFFLYRGNGRCFSICIITSITLFSQLRAEHWSSI